MNWSDPSPNLARSFLRSAVLSPFIKCLPSTGYETHMDPEVSMQKITEMSSLREEPSFLSIT